MRLLVTNTVTPPAYFVVRALRPYADTVIATTYGPRPVNNWPTCHSAYSRLVDRRYSVLDPERDCTKAGFNLRIQSESKHILTPLWTFATVIISIRSSLPPTIGFTSSQRTRRCLASEGLLYLFLITTRFLTPLTNSGRFDLHDPAHVIPATGHVLVIK